ncbi:kinase-like domain-containing protein [Globomyces pollinis-pini]|nr:kinase-like domain-containing protein [Globomyces pollinis-pini]
MLSVDTRNNLLTSDLLLPDSNKLLDSYELGLLLGEGLSGVVRKAVRKSDKMAVAIKFIRKSSYAITHWKFDRKLGTTVPMEIFILQRLNHPGIVTFIEMIEDPDYFYLVMELCGSKSQSKNLKPENLTKPTLELSLSYHERWVPSSPIISPRRSSLDLFDFIDTNSLFPEDKIKHIFRQVAEAILYLHRNNLVHRDIKDENIVIDDKLNTKLVDFGVAHKIPSTKREYFHSFRGTLLYTPPEIIANPIHRGPEADMWCLGVLLFTLSYSKLPYLSIENISKNIVSPKMIVRSKELQSLIDSLLCRDVPARLTIEQTIKHPWLGHTTKVE